MNFDIEQSEETERFLNEEIKHSTQVKFAKVFRKVQDGTNTAKDFKKLSGNSGIYEFRVSDDNSWFRVLAFMVHFQGDETPTIVTTHGFKKKKNKIPKSEIDRAVRIKNTY